MKIYPTIQAAKLDWLAGKLQIGEVFTVEGKKYRIKKGLNVEAVP